MAERVVATVLLATGSRGSGVVGTSGRAFEILRRGEIRSPLTDHASSRPPIL
ncbi:hypothetical protein [Halalkalicoccus paucihalophilus]|uniref:hypothetical protein n=1 Tax=Halalkalicoccus paucihalophilus TaxID=1008153 RepID=UPI000A6FBA50|nr:hypothetical protein [Halalkalicoccus paucihalophilus]